METKALRVVLADDHQMVLEGLSKLLADEFDVIGTASNGLELLRVAAALQPDVIVVDVSMPLLNGIEAVRRLRDDGNRAHIVCLSMHPDVAYATRALDAGASGYVLKHAAADELVRAIKVVVRGGTFLSEAVKTPVVEDRLVDTGRRHRATVELTSRQRQILQLIAEGKSAKEIGGLLEISPRTVESHKYRMMEDLGLKTNAQLVQHAIRLGLVPGA